MSDLTLWKPADIEIVPQNATSPAQIAECATQLSTREKLQVAQAFQIGNYEMATNFIWTKAMAALKRELATLGIRFIGEMLNKPDLSEDDDVNDVVTDKEAVRLAEELGIVTSTEGIRLRHSQELILHFSKLDANEIDSENVEMEATEGIQILKTCIKNILGKPRVEVAKKFVEFRDALESETLRPDDDRVSMLLSSPYFFRKLTISILLSVIKKGAGARLENALANINILLPPIWPLLRDTEKWQVGHTYAEVYADGKSTAVGGIKDALLKVKGFDYVPENLRSDTFIKAAEAIIRAHEGMNNFYNEESPVRTLFKLGSTIPTPAFPICASSVLAVRLGNAYGVSWAALPTADSILDKFTEERWQYYLNQCLPGDIRIIHKLGDRTSRTNWFFIVEKYKLSDLNIKNKDVAKLIKASVEKDETKTSRAQQEILNSYYGKAGSR